MLISELFKLHDLSSSEHFNTNWLSSVSDLKSEAHVCLRDWVLHSHRIQLRKENHGHNDQANHKNKQNATYRHFLEERGLCAKLFLSIVKVEALRNIQIWLNLSKLNRLEYVQRRPRKRPVNNSAEFEEKRYVVPNLKDGFAHHIEVAHHKATFFELRQPQLYLVSLKAQIHAHNEIENN